MPAHVTAVRGPLIWFRDDPFLVGRDDAFVYESDGLLICEGGVITAAGDYGALRERLPRGTTVDHYPDHVITAGFVDSHIHYVQTGIIPRSAPSSSTGSTTTPSSRSSASPTPTTPAGSRRSSATNSCATAPRRP